MPTSRTPCRMSCAGSSAGQQGLDARTAGHGGLDRQQLFTSGARVLGADLRHPGASRIAPVRCASYRAVRRASGLNTASPAADINPYLAIAVAIGSGLWGIEHRIEPDPADGGPTPTSASFPAKRQLPRTADRCRGAAGAPPSRRRNCSGARSSNTLPPVREWEEREFRRAVTDWELARYFRDHLRRKDADHQPGRWPRLPRAVPPRAPPRSTPRCSAARAAQNRVARRAGSRSGP